MRCVAVAFGQSLAFLAAQYIGLLLQHVAGGARLRLVRQRVRLASLIGAFLTSRSLMMPPSRGWYRLAVTFDLDHRRGYRPAPFQMALGGPAA